MKTKAVNVVLIAVFLLALLLPAVFINPAGGRVSQKENRMLASRPPFAEMLTSPSEYIRQFDRFFADNVGFREPLIDGYDRFFARVGNNVQYTEGQTPMLIGEEGHHYHAGGRMIEKFQGKPFLSAAQIAGLAEGLESAKQYLEDRGIPLIFMLCTDKETVYPEYYPPSILRGPGPTPVESITRYLRERTDVDLFDIRECLLAAKKEYLVYPKDGDINILSHYSQIGGFFAYQELMKHIGRYRPELEAFTLDDVLITTETIGSYPDIPNVQLKQGPVGRLLDASFFDPVPLTHPMFNLAYEGKDGSLPILLLMRDSYAGEGYFLTRYLPQHFSNTITVHWRNMEFLTDYVEYFQPDIVVFEVVEREIEPFAYYMSLLKDLE